MDDRDLHHRMRAVEQEQVAMRLTLGKLEIATRNQNATLDSILSWVKWGVRLVVGAIVVALVGALFAVVLKGH